MSIQQDFEGCPRTAEPGALRPCPHRGALVYVFSRTDRMNVRHNLDVVFEGRVAPASRQQLLWRFFRNYAFYMVDFFRLLGMTLAESRSFAELYEGREHLDEALKRWWRLRWLGVDPRVQQSWQIREDVPDNIGQSQNFGAHECIRTDSGYPREQEPVHLVFQLCHMCQEHLRGQTKIRLGDALCKLEESTVGRLRDTYLHAQMGEKSRPHGLELKEKEGPWNTHHWGR